MDHRNHSFIGLACRWCGKSGDPEGFGEAADATVHFLKRHGGDAEARKEYRLDDPRVEGSRILAIAKDLGLVWVRDHFADADLVIATAPPRGQ